MRKWNINYKSMTAFYKLPSVYAETKEEAEREARARATAFSAGEKTLIHATEDRS